MLQNCIALLRGINVGGKKVLMADLKLLYAEFGLQNISTYIQSGNVLFATDRSDTDALADALAAAMLEQYGFEVPTLVRPVAYLQTVAAQNPFLLADPHTPIERLHVTFLAQTPTAEALQKLAQAQQKLGELPDFFHIKNDAAYISCEKYHETKFSNAFFEKQLGIRTTTRNWKTVLQLAK